MIYNFEKGRIKLFKSGYTQLQVDGINAIVKEANEQRINIKAQLAYILATGYHEGYNPKDLKSRLTPITEFGGEIYLKKRYYWPWIGRGYVQLTHEVNYKYYHPIILKKFGVDILKDPKLLLRVDIAAFVIVHGMINGTYTKRYKLNDYIGNTKVDFEGARKIVNGVDRKELIAGYARNFLECIE